MLDILCAMVETIYECIPLTTRVASKEGKCGRQFLPGWKDTIAPLKIDSIFWHSVWISAGRPVGAPVGEKASKLLAAAESGYAALLKEMRETLTKKCTGQSVPDCLEEKVTDESILDKFRECYEDLYNSADTSDAMTAIKERLEELINVNSLVEVTKITGRLSSRPAAG